MIFNVTELIQTDTEHFTDASVFRPERFLQGTSDFSMDEHRHPFSFIPFRIRSIYIHWETINYKSPLTNSDSGSSF